MPDYAEPRPNWTPGGDVDDLERWLTEKLRREPAYRLPRGYETEAGGQVRRQGPGFMFEHPWLFPAAGIGAGAALSAAGAGAGAAAGAGTGAGAAAGGGMPGWLEAVLRLGGPIGGKLIIDRLTRRGGSGGGGDPFGGGDLGGQISSLLDLSRRRLERTEPVHQAAMQLALKMAPGGSDARVRESSQMAMSPTPQRQTDPRVLEALQRLMGGGR